MAGRLVLCLDGTWNSAFAQVERDDKTTVLKPANPLKLARAVLPSAPDDGTRQLTYYDSGVGALGLYPGVSNWLLNFFDSKLGGAWGAGFEANVEQAATFICHNHGADDQIYVFGFSRGAAQARALTHFIEWMGGIPGKEDAYYIPILFRHYQKKKGGGSPRDIVRSNGYVPADHVRSLKITYLGVWDTVMALGSRFGATSGTSVKERSFHVLPAPPICVKHARQALAIDEMRYDFRAEIWQSCSADQTLEQRWFPGTHGNVGGSYNNDGLANAALHWIVDEAKRHGLAIDDDFLGKYVPYPQDSLGDSYSTSYKVIESVRFRRGQGVRPLTGYPDSANLSVDPSAIKRLCSDPKDFERMKKPYRSAEVVKLAQKQKDDKKAFLSAYGLDATEYTFPDDI